MRMSDGYIDFRPVALSIRSIFTCSRVHNMEMMG